MYDASDDCKILTLWSMYFLPLTRKRTDVHGILKNTDTTLQDW
jgi:hypothetical protein